jgi:hypothetical protein
LASLTAKSTSPVRLEGVTVAVQGVYIPTCTELHARAIAIEAAELAVRPLLLELAAFVESPE